MSDISEDKNDEAFFSEQNSSVGEHYAQLPVEGKAQEHKQNLREKNHMNLTQQNKERCEKHRDDAVLALSLLLCALGGVQLRSFYTCM